MRRALLLPLLLLAPAAPADARAAVDVMVVGRERVLEGPKRVALRARTVKVGARRCAAGRATPLSVLAGLRVPIGLRDYGSCGARQRDSGSLYVSRVGSERARGRAGWVYKVGRRKGTAGAADPAGPFGDGRRLRDGQRVLWFWCSLGRGGSCRRTLEAAPVALDGRVQVTVRGYDDAGAGVPVEGATVRLAGTGRRATTGAGGVASLAARAGRHRVVAAKAGMVRSFPAGVRVG
jgi:hypothetical protein